jgi:hypothetical protein
MLGVEQDWRISSKLIDDLTKPSLCWYDMM